MVSMNKLSALKQAVVGIFGVMLFTALAIGSDREIELTPDAGLYAPISPRNALLFYRENPDSGKYILWEYNLSKTKKRGVVGFEAANVYSPLISQDGRYFVYGTPSPTETLVVMFREDLNSQFEPYATVGLDCTPGFMMVYDEWKAELLFSYERQDESGKWINENGVLKIGEKPFLVREEDRLRGLILAVSKRYYYVNDRYQGGFYFLRVSKDDYSRTPIIEFKDNVTGVLVVNDDTFVVAKRRSVESTNDVVDIYVAEYNNCIIDLSEYTPIASFPGYKYALDPVISPSGEGFIIENRSRISRETNKREPKRVYLLNIENGNIEELFSCEPISRYGLTDGCVVGMISPELLKINPADREGAFNSGYWF
jgi:hypothetical protein